MSILHRSVTFSTMSQNILRRPCIMIRNITNIFYATEIPRYTKFKTYSSSSDNVRNQSKMSTYEHLRSKIVACGPISVKDYMKEVLIHPTTGYYMNKDVFGQKGDFTTSPEISQLFGEMIAVWMINEYGKITDGEFQIVELGPGRGTMMKDILRVLHRLKYSNKASVHLVELSPALSMLQAKQLCTTYKEYDPVKNNSNSVNFYRKGITEDGVNIYWYYSIKDIPKKFTIFLAHEFFDALPIHKFQKMGNTWHEVLIDVENPQEESFRFVLSPSPTLAANVYIEKNETRSHVEISPETMVTVEYMSQFLWECGGFSLIIDYGHDGEKTDTFRAYSRHKQENPLKNPGTMDLTADVDFSIIKKIATKDNRLIALGPIAQKDFLISLGINARLSTLLKEASSEERKQLQSGYNMIMNEMGTAFKVLSLFPSVLQEHLKKWPVAGFHFPPKI